MWLLLLLLFVAAWINLIVMKSIDSEQYIEYETNRLYKELKRLLKETESKLDNCSNSSKEKEYIEFIELNKNELKEWKFLKIYNKEVNKNVK